MFTSRTEDVPFKLGSNGPGTSVAWWIDGPAWKNHNDDDMDSC